MRNDEKVLEILETILETNCEPEVACLHHPDLLPEIHRRLHKIKKVERQIDELFPNSSMSGNLDSPKMRVTPQGLPSIRGYEVQGILGSGGMGVVYKARHEKLNRVVALKMLRAGQFATERELTRFAHESQVIAEMHCPHIVQVHDVGDSDGRPFFTMELVEGGSLAEHLQGTPQPAKRAAELVQTLAEAIHSAHDNGIIHRDLKPANILLSRDGCPKIADFGLARRMDCEHRITISGTLLGTPSYMAPEQVLGGVASIGPSVDVYALGAILYEMLTGRPPFRAESAMETQRQVTQVEPVPPARINASVPRDLETICLKCLSKHPKDRYTSAAALAADLVRFLNGNPIHARPVSTMERSFRWMKRNPAATGFALTAAGLFSLAVLFAFREFESARLQSAEIERWKQRLEFVNRVEQEGRFTEARAILGRIPDGGSTILRTKILQAQRELDLAERLDEIRMSRGKFTLGGGIDYAESSRQYSIAFRDWNIGAVGSDPSKAAEKVRSSSVSFALITALDDWAACADATTRNWVLDVSRSADPDPWRDQVRNQEKWADLDHLQNLADSADLENHPVALLVAMGTRWRRLEGDPKQFLKNVHRIYPNDFWLNFELALQYTRNDPSTSLGYNLAALTCRPDAASVHFNLGGTCEQLKRFDDARFHFERTIEIDPSHTWAHCRLGITLLNLGLTKESMSHFRKAISLEPNYTDPANGLRIALIRLGQLEEAVTVWEKTLSNPNAEHEEVDGIAELQLYLGNDAKYHHACEVMLTRFGESTNALVCERLGRSCLLKPKSQEVQRKATELIDRSMVLLTGEQQWAKPYIRFAMLLSEYRAGQFENIVQICQSGEPIALEPGPDLVLSLALSRLRKFDLAKEALTRAEKTLEQNDQEFSREKWLFEILRRETRDLISQSN